MDNNNILDDDRSVLLALCEEHAASVTVALSISSIVMRCLAKVADGGEEAKFIQDECDIIAEITSSLIRQQTNDDMIQTLVVAARCVEAAENSLNIFVNAVNRRETIYNMEKQFEDGNE